MNQVNELQRLKTIVISEENYNKLKRFGSMGESFNDILSRILEKEDSR
jgi:predicted CopG family antitoxin